MLLPGAAASSATLEEALTIARTSKFNEGFAIGLGSIIPNVSEDALPDILSAAATNIGSTRNFGFALGHVFSLLDSKRRQEILKVMQNKGDFLIGLGEGLGHTFPSAGSRPLEEAMHIVGPLNALTRGAARGITESFVHLNLTQVLAMLEYATTSNSEFGEVLGEGLGEKFASLDEEKQSIILNALQKNNNFSRTFAKIIQKNIEYMSPQKGRRIMALVQKFSNADPTFEEKDGE